jgi:Ni/Co efflux regulator RcnB
MRRLGLALVLAAAIAPAAGWAKSNNAPAKAAAPARPAGGGGAHGGFNGGGAGHGPIGGQGHGFGAAGSGRTFGGGETGRSFGAGSGAHQFGAGGGERHFGGAGGGGGDRRFGAAGHGAERHFGEAGTAGHRFGGEHAAEAGPHRFGEAGGRDVHGARAFSYHGHSFDRIRGDRYRWRDGDHYRRWAIGRRLPREYWGRDYYFDDYADYGIDAPPYGYQWVRYGPDLLLVSLSTGLIAQSVYGAFDDDGGDDG